VRGIEKRRIVDDVKDREKFVARMGQIAAGTETSIYAWSLMTNHAHILVRSGTKGLAVFMRRLLTGYAVDYNLRHRRHGHLFQNRYKSVVCDEDVYFRELIRYIHLNPLRVGLVKELAKLDRYRWCGHSVLMGKVDHGWQDRTYVLSWFGKTEKVSLRAYRQYMEEGIPLGRRPELVGGGLIRSAGGWSQVISRRRKEEPTVSDERILGGGDFVQTVLEEAANGIRHQLPNDRRVREAKRTIDKVCKEKAVCVEELRSGSRRRLVSRVRSQLTQQLVRNLGLSQAEAARLLGVTTPAIAKSLMRSVVDKFT
jgi:putative transposase